MEHFVLKGEPLFDVSLFFSIDTYMQRVEERRREEMR